MDRNTRDVSGDSEAMLSFFSCSVSMCLQFVCKQSDENHLVHGCLFLAVIFRHFFQCVMTVSWNQPQPGCWNYLYYIFICSCMYTVQIKTVFNSVSFSTEVHAHFWALSHIYNAALFDCHMAGAISMHFMYTIQPCTMSRHFIQSHIHRVHLTVTCPPCTSSRKPGLEQILE